MKEILPILSTLGVPVFSFLFGALLTRWWNRARPLVVLQGFSSFHEPNQLIDYPPELQQLTGNCWFSNRFQPGKVRFNAINFIFLEAKNNTPQLEDAAEKAALWQDRLEKVPDSPDSEEIKEIKNVLQELTNHQGMNIALANALLLEELLIDKLESKPEKCIIEIPITPNYYDGCYVIPWTRLPAYFGAQLNIFPFLKERLQPFVDAMQYLNKDLLHKAIKEIVPLIERQIRILHHIRDLSEKIVNEYTQWAARILVENYGASPMLISPKARLVVKGEGIKKEGISLDCNLYFIRADSGNPEKLEGLHILGPGEKSLFWAITTKLRKDVPEPSGGIISELYQKKDAVAKGYVKLSFVKVGFFREKLSFLREKSWIPEKYWEKSSISNDAVFNENLFFPKTPDGTNNHSLQPTL